MRYLPVALIGIAVVVGIRTLTGSGSSDTVPTSVTATTASAQQDDHLAAYSLEVGLLAANIEEALAQAASINVDWDNSYTDYQTTVNRLDALAADVTALANQFRDEPPEGAAVRIHRAIQDSLGKLWEAALVMKQGLESTDSGELRRSGLLAFETAGFEISLLADRMVESLDGSVSVVDPPASSG